MEDNELRTLSFKVSTDEVKTIDLEARNAGLSRSDYIRDRLLNARHLRQIEATPSQDTILLLHHLLYAVQRVHTAVYGIATASGPLTPSQLGAISDQSAKDSLEFLNVLDESLSAIRQKVAQGA